MFSPGAGGGAEGERPAHPSGTFEDGRGQGCVCRGHGVEEPGHRPEEQGAHRCV